MNYSCHTISSLIQTILSVLEFHQISCSAQVADYTAGGEFHPAPKNDIYLFANRISQFASFCNIFMLSGNVHKTALPPCHLGALPSR